MISPSKSTIILLKLRSLPLTPTLSISVDDVSFNNRTLLNQNVSALGLLIRTLLKLKLTSLSIIFVDESAPLNGILLSINSTF